MCSSAPDKVTGLFPFYRHRLRSPVMSKRPGSFAILTIGLFGLLAVLPAESAWGRGEADQVAGPPGAVVCPPGNNRAAQGPKGIQYTLWYSKLNDKNKWVWAGKKNSVDMAQLHKEGKNCTHDPNGRCPDGRKRQYRHYTEPADRVDFVDRPIAPVTPLNYTITAFGVDPTGVVNPQPVPEYNLCQCIGSGWVCLKSDASYDVLFNQVPATGSLQDCSEPCTGGTGYYYKICPGPCPRQTEYKYHFPPAFPVPITPTGSPRFCHCW
jgi:hypothetical protein